MSARTPQIRAFSRTGSCDHRAMLHVSEDGAAMALRWWSSGDRKAEIEFASPCFATAIPRTSTWPPRAWSSTRFAPRGTGL